MSDAHAGRLRQFFETLTTESVASIADFYTEDACFKDPFNEVRGLPAVQRVFTHMFEQLDNPRFHIERIVAEGNDAFLTWECRFRLKGAGIALQSIRGATHIQFAPDGRVSSHRDYWDAAEELYEKLPLLGTLMRWLKRQAAG